MRPSYDISGASVTAKKDYDIATGTVITEGEVVQLSSGKVIPGTAAMTTAILGVAAEAHSGAADPFYSVNGHSSTGLRVSVYDSPSTIFEAPTPQATATSGTATTLVVSGLGGVFVDADFVGGYMKLLSKVTASTNTDPIGTVYPITGSTAASGTFTTTQTAGGAVTAGDVFAIFPPIGFAKGNLDAGFTKLVLTATAAIPFRIADFDLNRNVVFHEATLSSNANKAS